MPLITNLPTLIQRVANRAGLHLIITGHRRAITLYRGFPKDMDPAFKDIYHACQPYTMTSLERMYALYQATSYVVANQLPGDIALCGIWKGGSAMVVAKTLIQQGDTTRRLYLYDTYAGMTEPTAKDRRISDDRPAHTVWQRQQRVDHNEYAYAPLEEVKANMHRTNYPSDQIKYVVGKVEDTIPTTTPQAIALLRLDTDWYQSTYHELHHLHPRLVKRGILIIDDYGHFTGARDAVDEYFRRQKEQPLLMRVDYTGRVGIKL